jgi:hypothetical protein
MTTDTQNTNHWNNEMRTRFLRLATRDSSKCWTLFHIQGEEYETL